MNMPLHMHMSMQMAIQISVPMQTVSAYADNANDHAFATPIARATKMQITTITLLFYSYMCVQEH